MCWRKSIKRLDKNELRLKINSNIPPGYRFLKHYDPTKIRNIKAKSVLLWAIVLIIALLLNIYIRHEFDGFKYLFDGFQYLSQIPTDLEGVLIIILNVVLISIIVGVIHEGIHGLFYIIFTHKMPLFGCRKCNPYTALPIHKYLSKLEAIISALAPLCLVTIGVFIAWFFISVEFIPRLIFFGVTLVASTIGDMYSFHMLLSERDDILVGFDGIAGAIYMPNSL